jgi:hypothetical protein
MAPANSYVSKEDIKKKQKEYPLKILVCETCWLVQTEDFADKKEFFSNTYAYFSSTSQSWLNHAKEYVDKIIKLENLSKQSFVIEIASNDGYLLKNFLEVNIPCLGIEPTKSTADAAEKIGIPVLREFFDKQLGLKLALDQKKADLIIGNNNLSNSRVFLNDNPTSRIQNQKTQSNINTNLRNPNEVKKLNFSTKNLKNDEKK